MRSSRSDSPPVRPPRNDSRGTTPEERSHVERSRRRPRYRSVPYQRICRPSRRGRYARRRDVAMDIPTVRRLCDRARRGGPAGPSSAGVFGMPPPSGWRSRFLNSMRDAQSGLSKLLDGPVFGTASGDPPTGAPVKSFQAPCPTFGAHSNRGSKLNVD